jgi:hypothetical protein
MLIVEQALPAWPLLRVILINLIPAEAHCEAGSAYMVAGKAYFGPPYIVYVIIILFTWHTLLKIDSRRGVTNTMSLNRPRYAKENLAG